MQRDILFVFFTKSLNNSSFDKYTDDEWANAVRKNAQDKIIIIRPEDWNAPDLQSIDQKEAAAVIKNPLLFIKNLQPLLRKHGVPDAIAGNCMTESWVIPFPDEQRIAYVLPFPVKWQNMAGLASDSENNAEKCWYCKKDNPDKVVVHDFWKKTTERGYVYYNDFGQRVRDHTTTTETKKVAIPAHTTCLENAEKIENSKLNTLFIAGPLIAVIACVFVILNQGGYFGLFMVILIFGGSIYLPIYSRKRSMVKAGLKGYSSGKHPEIKRLLSDQFQKGKPI